LDKKKHQCEGCHPSQSEEEMEKLNAMLKNKVPPTDCPYMNTCENKVLPDEFQVLCKDQETSREAVMYHVKKHHVWENCKHFRDRKLEVEGQLPRTLNTKGGK